MIEQKMDKRKYDFKHRPSAEYRFFLFDPEGDGMTFFRDESERDAYAKTSINEYCVNDEGWSEDVESVCVGAVTGIATKTNIVKRPPEDEIDEEGVDGEGNWWDPEWSEKCNYELLPIPAPQEDRP